MACPKVHGRMVNIAQSGRQISMTECSGYENNIAAMLMQRRGKAGPERVNRQNWSHPGNGSALLESSLSRWLLKQQSGPF